ncbi:MAG TPA: flagellar hook-length control protein FliK [Xanthobacteraceae bacterium]|nr:flagellar hook-length control protein FliK [Xanthobacteraceae bacterium]
MASVAADTSAIAPPLSLPSRSDAVAPAGPSGAFADLLDASAPATASQPQTPSAARGDDGPSGAQSEETAGNGTGNPAGTGAATSKPRPGKDRNDQTTSADNGAAGGGTTIDTTSAAGLPTPPFGLTALTIADQTPAGPQDAQLASPDPPSTAADGPPSKSADGKDANAPSGPVIAGLAAALPGTVLIAAAVSDSSKSVARGPLASAPATTLAPGTPAAGAGAAASDASSPQLPETAQQATLPPTDPLQIPAVAGGNGGSDQNARLAPIASSALAGAPSGTPPPLTGLAPLNNQLPPARSPVAAIETTDSSAGTTGSPPASDAMPIAAPSQIAVRFAGSVHADEDTTSDTGTNALFGSAGAGAAGTAASGNDQPGLAILPSFNSAVATALQATPGAPTAPQHAAAGTDAVPLAGIPIAIVARAEAGEKQFEIRLDPPELGRIEVQLNVDSSGRATSHLVVDRPDTLDLLRRDAPALERALQSAGLTTDNGALQFSLRDQSFAGRDQGASPPLSAPTAAATENDAAPIDAALRSYGPPAGLGGGVDIRV